HSAQRNAGPSHDARRSSLIAARTALDSANRTKGSTTRQMAEIAGKNTQPCCQRPAIPPMIVLLEWMPHMLSSMSGNRLVGTSIISVAREQASAAPMLRPLRVSSGVSQRRQCAVPRGGSGGICSSSPHSGHAMVMVLPLEKGSARPHARLQPTAHDADASRAVFHHLIGLFG